VQLAAAIRERRATCVASMEAVLERAGAVQSRLNCFLRIDADAALAEIELGIPAITPALAERFVAQMLNLDGLDAVSFDKGCYPGQEIIARIHNLGGVKRRARRYAAPVAPPALGTPVHTVARGA